MKNKAYTKNRFSNPSLRLSDVMSNQYNKLRILIDAYLEKQENRKNSEFKEELKKEFNKWDIPVYY